MKENTPSRQQSVIRLQCHLGEICGTRSIQGEHWTPPSGQRMLRITQEYRHLVSTAWTAVKHESVSKTFPSCCQQLLLLICSRVIKCSDPVFRPSTRSPGWCLHNTPLLNTEGLAWLIRLKETSKTMGVSRSSALNTYEYVLCNMWLERLRKTYIILCLN